MAVGTRASNKSSQAPRASHASASESEDPIATKTSEVVKAKKKAAPKAKPTVPRTRKMLVSCTLVYDPRDSYSSEPATSDVIEATRPPPSEREQIRELRAQLDEMWGELKYPRHRDQLSQATSRHHHRRHDSSESSDSSEQKTEEDASCRRHRQEAITRFPHLLMAVLGALGVFLALAGLFTVLCDPRIAAALAYDRPKHLST